MLQVQSIIILLGAFALSGCTQWLPASVQTLKPNHYQVMAFGNSFANTQQLKEKIENKAQAFCSDLSAALIWQGEMQAQWQTQRYFIEGRERHENFKEVSRQFSCSAQ